MEAPTGVDREVFSRMTETEREIIRVVAHIAAQVEEMYIMFSSLKPVVESMSNGGGPLAMLAGMR